MKQGILLGSLLMAGVLLSVGSFGQNHTPAEKKSEEIIIRKNGDSAQKMTVEINGKDVTINGKPLSEYHGGDVQIIQRDFSEKGGPGENRMQYEIFNRDDSGANANQPFLGVLTEKADKGAKITEVVGGTAAEKAGLKPGDIITRLSDKEVNSPSDLLEIVKEHKPGDELELSYLRDGEKQDTKVTLGHRDMPLTNFMIQGMNPNDNNAFDFHMPNFDMVPGRHMPGMPQIVPDNPSQLPYGNFRFFYHPDARPKMGMKIQDTEEGNGAKVLSVEEGSPAAKAGLKKDDRITSINGLPVSGVDDVARSLEESAHSGTVDIKAKRNHREMSFEVKLPKKLKSADF